MSYLGDYVEDFATLNFHFTTRTTTGVPTVLAGSPVISISKGSTAAPICSSADAWVTLDIDHNGVVGLNHVLIDLSGDADFTTGSDYSVVITAGTVGGVNVFGEVVATFSIENRFDEVDLTKILGHLMTNTGTQIADAFQTMFDVASPTLLASAVMRGTDGANTTVPDAAGTAPTAAEIKTELEQAGSSLALILADTGTDGVKIGTGQIKSTSFEAGAIIAGAIAANAFESVKFADGFLAAGKIGSNALTSVKFATDAITANAIAADAVTEIQAGLATAAQAARALGLLQENQYIDTYTFNDDGAALTFRLRTYSVAGSVGTDNDVLATYNCTATYDDSGIASYAMVKA